MQINLRPYQEAKMSIKAKPATALPRLIIQREPYPHLRCIEEGEGPSRVILAADYEDSSATTYIARANAYPRLVEALQHTIWMAATRDRQAVEDALTSARDLLRELGEL
jgi:hypothetical protein